MCLNVIIKEIISPEKEFAKFIICKCYCTQD